MFESFGCFVWSPTRGLTQELVRQGVGWFGFLLLAAFLPQPVRGVAPLFFGFNYNGDIADQGVTYPLSYPLFIGTVSGGVPPYTFSVTSGAFPSGFGLNTYGPTSSTTVYVVGETNSAPGPYDLIVMTVRDSTGATYTANRINMSVCPPVSMQTNSVPNGALQTQYSATFHAAGVDTRLRSFVILQTLTLVLHRDAAARFDV